MAYVAKVRVVGEQNNGLADLAVDEYNRLIVRGESASPLPVETPAGITLAVSVTNDANSLPADLADATNTKSLSSTAATYTLPVPGGLYTIVVKAGAAMLLEGDGTQTATTTIGSGFSLFVDDQYPMTLRLNGPTISYVTDASYPAGGIITFLHHQE